MSYARWELILQGPGVEGILRWATEVGESCLSRWRCTECLEYKFVGSIVVF